jgi:ubiquinone biosynthesis protein Coq4
MYSYLYCTEKEIHIVHLDEKIADTLTDCGYSGISAEYVRKIKTKSIHKANVFFSKKYNNSHRHFSLLCNMDTEDFCYEEILTERRKTIMLKLGIYSDFLANNEYDYDVN